MMVAEKNQDVTMYERVLWILNTIFHQVVTVTVGFMFYIFFKYNDITTSRFIHVTLCTVAFLPLMAEGLMLFAESNVWDLKLARSKKSALHIAFLSASTVLVSVGIIFKIVNKNYLDEPHFVSEHAILGLVSWILCFVSILVGLITCYSPRLNGLIKPVTSKIIHNFLGLAAFVFGMGSLILGLNLPAFYTHTTDIEQIITTILLSKVTISCGIAAIFSFINQLNTIT